MQQSIQQVIQQVQHLVNQNQLLQAESLLVDIINKNPRQIPVYFLLINHLWQTEQDEKLRHFLSEIALDLPFEVSHLTDLVTISTNLFDRQLANRFIGPLLEKIQVELPEQPVLTIVRSWIEFRDYQQALALLEKAVHKSPASLVLSEQLVRCLITLAQFEAAGKELLRISSCAKLNPALFNQLLSLLSQKQIFADAAQVKHSLQQLAQTILQAITLQSPIPPATSFALAKYYKHQKQTELAWQFAQKANQEALSREGVHQEEIKQEGTNQEGTNQEGLQQQPFHFEQTKQAMESYLVLYQSQREKMRCQQNKENQNFEQKIPQVILVVGMPRSGTTLVEQQISKLIDGYCGGETPAAELAAQKSLVFDDNHQMIDFDPQKFRKIYLNYFRQFSDYRNQTIIDKVPTNFVYCGLFKLAFPDVKIVSLTRDYQDVALSIYFESFHPRQNFTFNLQHIQQVYHHSQFMIGAWKNLFAQGPKQDILFEIHYDDYLQHSEDIHQKLIEFFGESVHSTQNQKVNVVPIETPNVWSARQPVSERLRSSWKPYYQYLS